MAEEVAVAAGIVVWVVVVVDGVVVGVDGVVEVVVDGRRNQRCRITIQPKERWWT